MGPRLFEYLQGVKRQSWTRTSQRYWAYFVTALWTESGTHSIQGFFYDAYHIRSDAVRESYYPAFRVGSGVGVLVRTVIGIDPSEQAT